MRESFFLIITAGNQKSNTQLQDFSKTVPQEDFFGIWEAIVLCLQFVYKEIFRKNVKNTIFPVLYSIMHTYRYAKQLQMKNFIKQKGTAT